MNTTAIIEWGHVSSRMVQPEPGRRPKKMRDHAFRMDHALPRHSLCGVIVLQADGALVCDGGARGRCSTCETMVRRIEEGRPT